nr:DUF6525 family protein [uncultured Celeribacter sp.]
MTRKTRNLTSRLARRRARNPMADHDRLPRAARHWVSQAALPWSAASVARIWTRAMRETGSEQVALARLQAAEQATLCREAAERPLQLLPKPPRMTPTGPKAS